RPDRRPGGTEAETSEAFTEIWEDSVEEFEEILERPPAIAEGASRFRPARSDSPNTRCRCGSRASPRPVDDIQACSCDGSEEAPSADAGRGTAA
ncbi:hypothetical protein, partial [Brachybacterium sp. AOP3-A1-3]|uniref:hypothetical protein n=1 Tax=Brachybacterium sp. AOP3-A1-3 TaxID=3457699 RepID=UPI004033A12A